MSLQGNLQDFSITNILPIMKAESKTGVLEVKHKEDVVKITFEDGQVVYGETVPAKDMKRLRDTMIANRMISRENWQAIKSKHSNSLDSIWSVVTESVPKETASKLLNRQVNDAVFALLRFTKGAYRFIPSKKVEYPSSLIEPMDVDFLLMDGCRIADEWNMQEKRLPALNTFLHKSILPEQSPEESIKLKPDQGSRDFTESLEFEILQEQGIEINEHENKVLNIIGEFKTISDLMDMADLSNFDACSAIVSLLQKKIIKPIKRKEDSGVMGPAAMEKPTLGYIFVTILLVITLAAGFHRLLNLPQQAEAGKSLSTKILSYQASRKLNDAGSLLKLFYGQTGKIPANLHELVDSKLATIHAITDPWGREFQYKRKNGAFTLYSLGAEELMPGDEIFFTDE